jgi:hypothetical protein
MTRNDISRAYAARTGCVSVTDVGWRWFARAEILDVASAYSRGEMA